MSKWLKLMEKAELQKVEAVAVEQAQSQESGSLNMGIQSKLSLGLLIALMAISVTSLVTNQRVLHHLKLSKASANHLSEKLSESRHNMLTLKAEVEALKTFEAGKNQALVAEIDSVRKELHATVSDIDAMVTETDLMRVLVKDLRITDKELLENIIILEEKLDSIEKLKTEERYIQDG